MSHPNEDLKPGKTTKTQSPRLQFSLHPGRDLGVDLIGVLVAEELVDVLNAKSGHHTFHADAGNAGGRGRAAEGDVVR